MVMFVVFVVCWAVSNVPACVMLTMYWTMSPLCFSIGGRDHLIKIEVGDGEFACTLRGNPVGTDQK